jgi:hypothetical protein
MILFLYTNKNYEHQAISCIRSIEKKITDDVKVVYFTIGFVSTFETKNLIKIPTPESDYPSFNYYKAELSLKVMDMFPEEEHFVFTDSDVLFSRRIDFKKLRHNYPYPLASFGPHEQPYIWEVVNGETIVYNEERLMEYFNVKTRTVQYQWSCFYVFNRNCYEFFEEYTSMCKNKYLLKKRKYYFPFHDETPFNICLWKRNATQSLGYVFVNTHLLSTVQLVEENNITDKQLGTIIDGQGADWEYIHNSSDVIFYHGFKEPKQTEVVLDFLLNR